MKLQSKKLRGALVGVLAVSLACSTYTGAVLPASAVSAPTAFSTEPVGSLKLLTDPFLQVPAATSVNVVWFTEFPGTNNSVIVGDGVASLTPDQLSQAARGAAQFDGVRIVAAETTKLSQVAEDSGSNIPADVKPSAADGIVDRDVWRHEAVVTGLTPGSKSPYRVASVQGVKGFAGSGTFTLKPAAQKGQAQKILLTSDHQAMVNTPGNLQKAAETVGEIDSVFVAGDLVNIPDRASEWFDDTRGSAFFPVLQGNGGRVSTGGVEYRGGEIIQNASLFTAIGNHEVQGRRAGATGLNASFNAPVPRDIAEALYAEQAATVNPTNDPAVKEQWIQDNSFSTKSYEEILTLPESAEGGEKYYATTLGDVRLISLYSTRIWRGTTANPNPEDRNSSSRYQESKSTLENPELQGYGEHIFEAVDASSEQYKWLEKELQSDEFTDARYRVVILHEGPQGLGDNIMPVFANPERIEETNDAGDLVGVRYEYPVQDNKLLYELQPLLENAGVDLVQNGHSHLWNRFESDNGLTNFIETSNTGNTYGAYHPLSGRTRPLPPAPWNESNYWTMGNPGGLEPIVPNVRPFTAADGTPEPYVQSNNHAVFTVLDTGEGTVTSYVFDVKNPDSEPYIFDQFPIGRGAVTPNEGDIPLSVDVTDGSAQPGEFIWSVANNDVVDFGSTEDKGDHRQALSSLTPVAVTDTRRGTPAWSVYGQVSDFTSNAGTFPGKYLGWTPKVLTEGAGARPGNPVASGRLSGDGISVPSVLASARAGHVSGTAEVAADLDLQLPVDTEAGRYAAVVTITALG